MTIGRVAAAAGVSVETIRYYQRRGLLEEPAKPIGGYRRYPVTARVRSLKFFNGMLSLSQLPTDQATIATRIDKTSSPLLGKSPVASLLGRSEGRLTIERPSKEYLSFPGFEILSGLRLENHLEGAARLAICSGFTSNQQVGLPEIRIASMLPNAPCTPSFYDSTDIRSNPASG